MDIQSTTVTCIIGRYDVGVAVDREPDVTHKSLVQDSRHRLEVVSAPFRQSPQRRPGSPGFVQNVIILLSHGVIVVEPPGASKEPVRLWRSREFVCEWLERYDRILMHTATYINTTFEGANVEVVRNE